MSNERDEWGEYPFHDRRKSDRQDNTTATARFLSLIQVVFSKIEDNTEKQQKLLRLLLLIIVLNILGSLPDWANLILFFVS